MSQWSKAQDYGNSGSAVGESLPDGNWSCQMEERGGEVLKTIRCVIDKDFESRRLGSGDAGATAPMIRRESTRVVCAAAVDAVRLRNHLEWKKQKEAEYLRRREAERLEEERKKEKKLREEREKRRREKQREEKIREWQEQKAREKEERKRAEMMMKALEQEIKGVTQTLDKEKLIHEWIRLKNKQKQIEAEKKAEMMRREEETRALRQSLAEISYRQWKERTKNRRIILPKNGYQIFGPKPVPVVKEDWNHDFVKGDSDDRGMTARTPQSTVSMTSIRGPTLSRMDLTSQDMGKRSPSSCQLKVARSRSTVNGFDGRRSEMTLRISDSEERWKNFDGFLTEKTRRIFQEKSKDDGIGHQRPKALPNGFTTKFKLFNMETLPTKNKLDIYLQPPGMDATPESIPGDKPKKLKKPEDTLKKYLQGLSEVNSKLLITLNEKLSTNQIKTTCSRNSVPDRRLSRERNSEKRQAITPSPQTRRSRSHDKPNRKTPANRSSSLTSTDQSKKTDEVKKPKKLPQNRKPEAKERRKPKKSCKPEVTESPYSSKKGKSKSKPIKPKEE